MEWKARLINFLTKPHPQVTDLVERQRARLLAVLILFVFPIGLASGVIARLDREYPIRDNPELRIHVVALLLWSAAYLLSRSAHYRVGAWLAAILGIVSVSLISILTADPEELYNFVLLGIFATLMFRVHEALFIQLICLLAIVWVPFFQPAIPLRSVMGSVFIFVSFGLLLNYVAIQFIHQIEKERIEQLLESEASYRELLESSFQGVAVLQNERVTDLNYGFAKLFGYSPEEMKDFPLMELIARPARGQAAFYLQQGGVFETIGLRKDGTTFHIEVFTHRARYLKSKTHLLAVRDISSRKDLEARLFHEAFHDPLTGLPNRALLMDRLKQALERTKRNPKIQLAFVFIDLDNFKSVNDSHGHMMGDQVLKEFADRLTEAVRSTDTVSRLGGDEFVVLLDGVGEEKTDAVIRRIASVFDKPFGLDSHRIMLRGSLGLVPDIRVFSSAEEVLMQADIAMYREKKTSTNH